MVKLTIDGQPIETPPGETILQAARRAGVEIPTLCHVEGLEPGTSCFVCAVALEGQRKLVPACGMPVAEGMRVVTDSPAVRAARKAALDLLLSDHLGECQAPCELACPARWDIPGYMATLRAGDAHQAGRIAREGLVLPGVLGCVCPAPCQKACRRTERDEDESVAIRQLHRHTAGAAMTPPADGPLAGRRVAVVGAGPAGLAAADALRRLGAACAVLEAGPAAGGSLRNLPETDLPGDVLAADLAALADGLTFRFDTALGRDLTLEQLRGQFEALVLAIGAEAMSEPVTVDALRAGGLTVAGGRLAADARSRATSLPGIFAAGEACGRGTLAVRAIADGLAAAESVRQYLLGEPLTGPGRPALVRYGPLEDAERSQLWSRAANSAPQAGQVRDADSCVSEAGRCLLCGCRQNDRCRLRALATELGARTGGHRGQRRRLGRDDTHPAVVYEPHKCILCGVCVQIARAAGAGVGAGLTIVGRGFAGYVAVPYGGTWREALDEPTARRCAQACPTSAITLKERAD